MSSETVASWICYNSSKPNITVQNAKVNLNGRLKIVYKKTI